MTRSQAVALGLNVVNGMITFTLATQTDVSVPPLARYILGVAAVGIGILLTYFRIQPPPNPEITVPDGDKPVGGQ